MSKLLFLGQIVRKHGGKLLIKPSKASVKRLLNRLQELERREPDAEKLARPVLRGGSNVIAAPLPVKK